MSSPKRYPETAPQINTLLRTLSHHIRREIIRYFEHHSGQDTASLEQVADHIQARIPGTSREFLEAQLLHTHLPRLSERGWIDYDPRSTRIRYHGHEKAVHLLDEVRAML